MRSFSVGCCIAFCFYAIAARAQATPAGTEGDYVVENFHCNVMRAARVTNAVLILHGTTGTGKQFVSPQFAGVLFGPGQLLDATPHLHHPSRWNRPRWIK